MSVLEVIGFISGITGVWLTIRQNVWCFPVGLLNVTISLFLYIDQRLYSDSVQQVFYMILLTYGWINWRKKSSGNILVVTQLTEKARMFFVLLAIIIAIGMGRFFSFYTDADVPYLDASATALSFIAQYLIAKKKLETWYLWIVVNIMYIGIYFYKELYLYTALFGLYLLLAIRGLSEWKKSMQNPAYE